MFRHTSMHKGVTFDSRRKLWIGRFTSNGVHHYVGSFKQEKEAAEAVNQARVNVLNSNSLRNEVQDILKQEKAKIEANAPHLAPVKSWDTFSIAELKALVKSGLEEQRHELIRMPHAQGASIGSMAEGSEAAYQGWHKVDTLLHGSPEHNEIGDKRLKQTWIDALNLLDRRPATEKETQVAAAIAEIDDLQAHLTTNLKRDRDHSDKAVLDLHEADWCPCVIQQGSDPAYYWCNDGFIYTLFPSEGYTVWRFDETIKGNYRVIGCWNGPIMDVGEEQTEQIWQMSVDREAGTYCRFDKPEGEEGEILEGRWAEDAVMSDPLFQHRNHSFAPGKSAKR